MLKFQQFNTELLMFSFYSRIDQINDQINQFIQNSFNRVLLPIYVIYKPCKYFAIGRLWDYVFDNKALMKELNDTAFNSDNGVAVASLGAFGNIAVIDVRKKELAKEVLDFTDSQPKGRAPSLPFKFLTHDTNFFFASTSKEAIEQRKQLINFFKPSKLIDEAKIETCREMLNCQDESKDIMISAYKSEIDVVQSLTRIVNNTLMKVILGIEKIPEELLTTINEFGNRDITWHNHFPLLSSLSYSFQKLICRYQAALEKLWSEQISFIEQQLKNLDKPEAENLVLFKIIELIKKENLEFKTDKTKLKNFLQNLTQTQILKYLTHDNFRSLPLILTAAENLIKSLAIFLEAVACNPTIQNNLRTEIVKQIKSSMDFSDFIKQKTSLYGYFKDTARVRGGIATLVARYTSKEIKKLNIPGNTTLFVDFRQPQYPLGTQFRSLDPERWRERLNTPSPFSEGIRSCPAANILVDTLFQTISATMIENFKMRSQKTGKILIEPIWEDCQTPKLSL